MPRQRFGLEQFELYKVAREFRKEIYRLIKQLLPSERYCLDSQMRRAAISITNNIAEGHGCWHYKENIQFCRLARGSVEEVIDDLNICEDERYAETKTITNLKQKAQQLIHRINGYIAYLRKSKQGEDK